MSVGQTIIEEIMRQAMVRISFPDPNVAHVFVWSRNADEQLDALVMQSPVVQIPTNVMNLYAEALQILGAPDNGDPAELLEWAAEMGVFLKTKNSGIS